MIIKKSLGFTLMELMIVIAIISVGMMIAIPGFMKWRPDFHLKGASRDLLGNFQKAKINAVRHRRQGVITFTEDSNNKIIGYKVFLNSTDDAGDEIWRIDTDDELITEVTWEKNYPASMDINNIVTNNLSDNADNEYALAFLPNGLPTDPDGGSGTRTVTLANKNGKTINVEVSSAGSINIK